MSLIQPDFLLYALLLFLSSDVYRNCLTLSVISFLTNLVFLVFNYSSFWKNNMHLLVIMGGLALFYGFFLRIMYSMSLKPIGWQRGINIVVLLSLTFGMILTFSLPSNSMDPFYLSLIHI